MRNLVVSFIQFFLSPRNLQKMIQFDFGAYFWKWVDKQDHPRGSLVVDYSLRRYFWPCLAAMRSSMCFAGKGLR